MQPENFFKLVCGFARDLDSAASETQTRVEREATARAARRAAALTPRGAKAAGGSENPPGPTASSPDPSDWRKALRKIAGPVDRSRRPLRDKDTLNHHIHAYSKLGRGPANALLTRQGALQHLAQENITARQSVPALRVTTEQPGPAVAASQVRCQLGWKKLCCACA
jgi:hypothetical protein